MEGRWASHGAPMGGGRGPWEAGATPRHRPSPASPLRRVASRPWLAELSSCSSPPQASVSALHFCCCSVSTCRGGTAAAAAVAEWAVRLVVVGGWVVRPRSGRVSAVCVCVGGGQGRGSSVDSAGQACATRLLCPQPLRFASWAQQQLASQCRHRHRLCPGPLPDFFRWWCPAAAVTAAAQSPLNQRSQPVLVKRSAGGRGAGGHVPTCPPTHLQPGPQLLDALGAHAVHAVGHLIHLILELESIPQEHAGPGPDVRVRCSTAAAWAAVCGGECRGAAAGGDLRQTMPGSCADKGGAEERTAPAAGRLAGGKGADGGEAGQWRAGAPGMPHSVGRRCCCCLPQTPRH